MARDIEEFLRLAAARRQQQAQGAPQPPAAPAPPRGEVPAQKKPPPRPKPPVRQVPRQDILEILDEEQVAQPQVVSRKVDTQVDTGRMVSHAEELGQRITKASQKMGQRLQEKFDHDVGHLDLENEAASVPPTASTPTGTNEIVNLLRSPTSLRQSIILAEVLKRPDFD